MKRILFSTLVIQAVFVILALTGLHFLGLPYITQLDVVGICVGLLGGVMAYILIAMLTRSATPVGTMLRGEASRVLPAFKGARFWHIVCLSVLAGIGEEWLFRGLIQTAVSNSTWPLLGIITGAFVFGLFHFISVYYVIITTCFGLMIGVLYHFTGDLMMVMALHASYDLCALWVLTRAPHLLNIQRPMSQLS